MSFEYSEIADDGSVTEGAFAEIETAASATWVPITDERGDSREIVADYGDGAFLKLRDRDVAAGAEFGKRVTSRKYMYIYLYIRSFEDYVTVPNSEFRKCRRARASLRVGPMMEWGGG